jgi:hypothetical protein
MPDHGEVTTSAPTAPPQPPAAGARKRGRETAADMIRSLGIVMLIVVALWFFAQPPDSDEAAIRVVDPASDVAAWTSAVPAAPVLSGLPERWRPTSSRYERGPDRLRIGHVTPSDQYAEFAASTGRAADVVSELTGKAPRTGTVDVRGVPWESYTEADGSLSLVRAFGDVTVVVGTLRSTASIEELSVLAAAVG